MVLADEIREKNPKIHEEIKTLINEMDTVCKTQYVSHVELKEQTKNCKAVIRTGETTPYANIILQSACLF
ncbi:RbsD/FucU domain-containing protein [Lachnospiraceae bacterium 42-17]